MGSGRVEQDVDPRIGHREREPRRERVPSRRFGAHAGLLLLTLCVGGAVTAQEPDDLWDAVTEALARDDRPATARALLAVAQRESTALEGGSPIAATLAIARAQASLGDEDAARQLVEQCLRACQDDYLQHRALSRIETPVLEIADVVGDIDVASKLRSWLSSFVGRKPLHAAALVHAARACAWAGDIPRAEELFADAVAALSELPRDRSFTALLDELAREAAAGGIAPDLSALSLETPPRPDGLEHPWTREPVRVASALWAAQVLAPDDAWPVSLAELPTQLRAVGRDAMADSLEHCLVLCGIARPVSAEVDSEDAAADADGAESDAAKTADPVVRARAQLLAACEAFEASEAERGRAAFQDGTRILLTLRDPAARALAVPPALFAALPADDLEAFVGWLDLSSLPVAHGLDDHTPWAPLRESLATLDAFSPDHPRLRRDLGLAAALALEWARSGRIDDAVGVLRDLEPDAAWVTATAYVARTFARNESPDLSGELAASAREKAALDALAALGSDLVAPLPDDADARVTEAAARRDHLGEQLAEVLAAHPQSAVARAADCGPASLVTLLRVQADHVVREALASVASSLVTQDELDHALRLLEGSSPEEPSWIVPSEAWGVYRGWVAEIGTELHRGGKGRPAALDSGSSKSRRKSSRRSTRTSEGDVLRSHVGRSLRWLAAHQGFDGLWDPASFDDECVDGPCGGLGNPNYRVGVSGLALLALLNDGQGLDRGLYRLALRRGVHALLESQRPDGLISLSNLNTGTYDHLVATLALLETWDHCVEDGTAERWLGLRPAIERALDVVLHVRNPGAGWRYLDPTDEEMIRNPNDTSVTSWAIKVLVRARTLGFGTFEEAIEDGLQVLDEFTDASTGRTGYVERGGPPSRLAGLGDLYAGEMTESNTASAMLAQLLADPEGAVTFRRSLVERGSRLLLDLPIEWDDDNLGRIDFYYWMHATAAMARLGGAAWHSWSSGLPAITGHQFVGGCRDGSWPPSDPWGSIGGRIYATAMLTLILQEGLPES